MVVEKCSHVLKLRHFSNILSKEQTQTFNIKLLINTLTAALHRNLGCNFGIYLYEK